MVGQGRLAENDAIVAAVLEALGASQDLSGETVLITAGPTREKIDPVRYLTNRSSGRMGYALAEGALRRGARVLLVSGPDLTHSARSCRSNSSRIDGGNARCRPQPPSSSQHRDQDRGCGGLSSEIRCRPEDQTQGPDDPGARGHS